jgi:SOS-response transcriptional repressor LexA
MSKEAFETNCGTNSEPFALQNLGNIMEPEFSENCILIIDPGMRIHNRAYAVVRYANELYFRQYIERGDKKFLVPLSTQHDEIELKGDFEMEMVLNQILDSLETYSKGKLVMRLMF